MAYEASGIIRELVRQNIPTPITDVMAEAPVARGVREIAFDGVISIGHSMSISLTSYPTEAGADVYDHTYDNPITLQITGGVSLLADNTTPSRTWSAIQQLLKERKVLIVTTGLGIYSNILLTGAQTTESNKTQGALLATLDLKELLLPGGARTPIVATGPAANRFFPRAERGFQASERLGERDEGLSG